MRRIAIVTDDPGWHGKQLCRAFAERSCVADYISLTACRIHATGGLPIRIPGFEQNLPDAVFVRGVPGGSLEEVVFYLDVLHALKILGVPVYNDGRAVERSVDKAMTSFLLQNAGIATPKTWVLRDRDEALAIAENELAAGHYLISKPLFGSQGEGIRRIEKSTDLFWLTSSHGIYYLQRFIECDGEGYSDKRVFVINGKAIAAMRRRGVSWLNNVARGASCETIELSEAVSELAVKAVAALDMDYAGVDIIKQRDGTLSVIEVNSVPAWKGLQSVCGVNIADCLVEDLIGRHMNRVLA
ncbi:RimK family alpha-L-glutamate ligase [Methylomonas sp. LL1]|uniref:ATP-grasp domain-containing protein n=1 Tax=Methylomonas sp. LL1 TaxID=2785785 RepID=UPI0018C3F5A9|nr:RimK family alpha-L-glutamate ligase [Methylomonas sp. LL1]QPK64131.1 RimK family alpha-L-glutamate ligase [Methylomonas sp. LL1]